jgi:predicted nuclease of restriction endonuclease-like (RecB) superfamily
MNLSHQIEFYSEIRTLIEQSRKEIFESVNSAIIQTYWQVGKLIFEEEGNEGDHPEFGAILIENLKTQLTRDFGNGFDRSNLFNIRHFYTTFPNINALRSQLSWSHYQLIINVEDEKARLFYMDQAADNRWSVEQLAMQIQSSYYDQMLTVKTKEQEKYELPKNEMHYKPSDLIKDPFVLDFLDIKPTSSNLKQDLYKAVGDIIQDYLLSLANGFCLVNHQKYMVTELNKHYHIDLVFYNYLIRCFILIDLRFGELTPEDVFMMDRYIEMYDDKFKLKDDNPTFGILICSNNVRTEVKYASMSDRKQMFSTLYQLVIPSKEDLTEIVDHEVQHQISQNQHLKKYLQTGNNC